MAPSSTRQRLVALVLLSICHRAVAQNATAYAAASPTITFPSTTGYSTKTYNYALASTYLPNNDFSNEQLAFLWDQVGIISTGAINTTVSPTPEPSSFPRPGYLHPMVPAYIPSLSAATLPADFKWGVAGAAFQVEGAVKDEGKGPTIWDFMPHRQVGTTADNTTGDVTSNYYYLYKQDLARLKALGIPYNSQSIAWARIFPFGKGPVNEEGVAHYDDVIAEHVRLGIKPVITLFHWDTPLALFNEYGAWTSPQIVDDYFNYAKFIIERYDEYVDVWYSFNEPQYCSFQYASYPSGLYYPSYHNLTRGLPAQYACGHYTLLASAKIMKWYKEEFKGRRRISMKMSGAYYIPNTTSEADAAAVQRSYDYSLGWFSGSWTDGNYPASMRDTLGDLLPVLTAENQSLILGSQDFYAIDPSPVKSIAAAPPGGIEACASNSSNPYWPSCFVTSAVTSDGFPTGPAADVHAEWLWSNPTGIRGFLKKIMQLFPSVPDIVVSEFGFVEPAEGERTVMSEILWDLRRADYFQGYLDNILAARVVDGSDNIEWFSGEVTRFGLQYINYTDPTLPRTPKASMFQFLDFFAQHIPSLNASIPA
ncbi:hypothetical protein LTR36_004725 [Oleoguttula mirabilis]|uniref:Glycoside hydrolase family 1 protein n=1 Tax=Oleoguttula mirabilis TaxID=1507867 RepID=A0AAV9JGL3_9PEZI|nr:hypothetical protein LTR36_004725 [Oleoguttula mirabilis]